MGHEIDDIYVKVFVTGANIRFLGLADLFGSHGTAVRILAEALQRGFGGLWLDGHASVIDGVLRFDESRGSGLISGQDASFALDLSETQVSVLKSATGGLFPSSRLIVVQHGEDEVKIAIQKGHGDALGEAIYSWT
jgi:hypothetical protein